MASERAIHCPACHAQLVIAVRALDAGAMAEAATARWAKTPKAVRTRQAKRAVAGRERRREAAAEPLAVDDLEAAKVCLKCGHAEGCAERQACRCLHNYG